MIISETATKQYNANVEDDRARLKMLFEISENFNRSHALLNNDIEKYSPEEIKCLFEHIYAKDADLIQQAEDIMTLTTIEEPNSTPIESNDIQSLPHRDSKGNSFQIREINYSLFAKPIDEDESAGDDMIDHDSDLPPFIFRHQIGTGLFSKVFACQYDHKPVALKLFQTLTAGPGKLTRTAPAGD
jgi:hypothetical protein